MPDKNPAADRWGGPGGGGENVKQARPEPKIADDGEADRRRVHDAASADAPITAHPGVRRDGRVYG